MEKIASVKSNVKSNVEGLTNEELSLEALLSEQASELPEKALMRHRRRHHFDNSDYCYYRYDYCYSSDYCYYPPSYC